MSKPDNRTYNQFGQPIIDKITTRGLIILAALSFLTFILLSQSISGIPMTSALGNQSEGEFKTHLPIILNNYPADISGYVSYKGDPAAGIKLTLYFFNGHQWSSIAETKTGTNGFYHFAEISSLDVDQMYYVRFGPNKTEPKYVYSWYGPLIMKFNPGDSVSGGTFDIADIPLKLPQSGSVRSLPVTFTWDKRDFAVEDYRVVLLDSDTGQTWDTKFVRDKEVFTVVSLASDIKYGEKYDWYMEVFSEVDSFGESFMTNNIVFNESATHTANLNSDRFTVSDETRRQFRNGS